MRKVTGLTLVELLVVIGIIAVLISILLPTLNKAQRASQKIMCASNLRQLTTAWMLYANDNNGYCMPSRDYTAGMGYIYKFWSGTWDGANLHPERGFIGSYMRNIPIRACPSYEHYAPNNGQLGIAYNYFYLSPSANIDGSQTIGGVWKCNYTKVSKIRNSSQKVVFADCERNNKKNPMVTETTPFLCPPSYNYPGFIGRHGGLGNVAWADGHVSSVVPRVLRPSYTAGGLASIPKEAVEANKIGDIDFDGDPDTDEAFDPRS